VTVTRDSLRKAFPTFDNAPDDMVDAGIARAELQVDGDVLGTQVDVAVLFLACHEIAMDPEGEDLRLENEDGESAYLDRYTAVIRRAGAAHRVIS
jgi:hypothetical protein